MKFYPVDPPKAFRPIAFIVSTDGDAIRIADAYEDKWYRGKLGIALGLYNCIDCAVYSLVPPKQLIQVGGCHNWQIEKFKGRITKIIYDGKVGIYPLSTYNASPEEALVFFDAIAQYGVAPASFSTMAMRLWQRTLTKEVWIKEWSDKNVGRRSFIGGRKEAKKAPIQLSGADYLDIPAAYLKAMEDPLPLWIREDKAGWYDSGIALARITIPSPIDPSAWWGPIPSRIATTKRSDIVTYGWGTTRGLWTFDELRNARIQGCGIELERTWRGYREDQIFEKWLCIAHSLRGIDGPASKIAKHVTTRLWSLFGVNPAHKKTRIYFVGDNDRRDKREIEVPYKSRGESATFLSSMIASKVRVRVSRELLSRPGTALVDTDGGIVPSGVQVNGWRPKWRAESVEIRNSQAYRWKCGDCGVIGGHPAWHYSVSGMQPDSKYITQIFDWLNPQHMLFLSREATTIPAGEFGKMKYPNMEYGPLEGLQI